MPSLAPIVSHPVNRNLVDLCVCDYCNSRAGSPLTDLKAPPTFVMVDISCIYYSLSADFTSCFLFLWICNVLNLMEMVWESHVTSVC